MAKKSAKKISRKTNPQKRSLGEAVKSEQKVEQRTVELAAPTGELLKEIAERKQAEEELYKVNRTLRALSNSNQAMLHANSEAEFLKDVCRIIVEDCGHAMVWIGFAKENEGKTVQPVASAGFEEGYLKKLNVTWADTERGRGPTGKAIRTGRPSICTNMLTDPTFEPWREEAIKRGYASSIVLPLMADSKAFGAINIYSREPDPFTEDEVKLLSELAGDLSYGILAMRSRVAHAKAEEAVRQSEKRYRSLFNNMTEGFAIHEIITDNTGTPIDYRFLEINPAFEHLTGLIRDNVLGKTVKEVIPEIEPRWIKSYGSVALSGEPVHFESYSAALDKHYEVFAYCNAPRQFAVIFRDVTERKKTEEALEKSNQRLAILSETASQLLTSDRPQQIIEDLCRKVMTYLDCHVFLNFLLDEEKQRLHLNAYAGISEETAKKIEWLDLAVAVCGIAASDGRPIVYENIPETRDLLIDHIRSFGIKVYACYPLFSQDYVIGTLSFGTRSRLSFTEDELVLMKTVADQVSIAMVRMMILKELEKRVQERTEELSKAYETVKAERQQLFDVLDTLPAYVILLTTDYHVPFANRFFEERFGKSNGQRCYEYLFNRTEPCEICETYTVLKTNAPHHWEWTGPDRRNYDIYDFPFKDTDGSNLIMEVGLDITERKQAEMAIKEREKKYRTLIEQAAEAIAIFDQQLNFIDVNSAACQMTGFTREELLKLNVKDIIPEEDFVSIPPQLAEVIAGKKVENESRLRRKDGTLINIRLSAKMLENGMVQTITRDITERKKTEERNRLITNLLELFIKTSSRKEYLDSVVNMLQEWTGCRCIGIRILDKEGNIPYESYRGFSQDFWQQENWISVKDQCACTRVVLQKLNPQDMSMITPNGSFRCNNTDEFAKGLTEKDISRYRGLCIRIGFKSLAIVPIHYKETVLGAFHIADRHEGMVPVEKIEFIESISPLVGEAILRFSAEEELLKSESRLSEAQRVAHLGNWDWNIQTNQLYWSDEIYRIFGLSPQQFGVTYDAFLDFVHPEDREALKKAVNKALYEKKPYRIEHRIVLPDGTVRIVNEQAQVMFDYSGKPVRMLGIVRDITDRKKVEDDLKESYEQLRNLSEHLQSIREEERTNIAREIHDELGQALTALKMDISMISNKLYPDHKPLVEKTGLMLKRIDETIQTVKKICTELRPTVLDHFGLSAAIEWQAEDFQKTTGINCKVSFHPEDIVLDQDISIVIFRIFQEAMTNIMRHADATEVKASLKAKDNVITLEVIDNGKGITEEKITNSSSFGLLGMRERVNFLGGNVTISGVKNKGTTIRVNIPFKKKGEGHDENTHR
jgi:PAS domain S-box-containing protein